MLSYMNIHILHKYSAAIFLLYSVIITVFTVQGAEEACIMRGFVSCALHQILKTN